MLTIKGIYGREMYETWYKMTVMLQSGLDITPVITHRFAFRDYEEAFATAGSGAVGQGRPELGGTHEHVLTDREHLRASSAEIRDGGPVQGRAGDRNAAERPRRASAGREVLNLCANNYLGLADHPGVIEAAHEALDRWGYGMASRAVHLRHAGDPQAARAAHLASSSGTEDTILYVVVLRRQRRAVRDAARRRGRGHLRRAEPRLDHRRHPAVQGAAAAATATATWPTSRRS